MPQLLKAACNQRGRQYRCRGMHPLLFFSRLLLLVIPSWYTRRPPTTYQCYKPHSGECASTAPLSAAPRCSGECCWSVRRRLLKQCLPRAHTAAAPEQPLVRPAVRSCASLRALHAAVSHLRTVDHRSTACFWSMRCNIRCNMTRPWSSLLLLLLMMALCHVLPLACCASAHKTQSDGALEAAGLVSCSTTSPLEHVVCCLSAQIVPLSYGQLPSAF